MSKPTEKDIRNLDGQLWVKRLNDDAAFKKRFKKRFEETTGERFPEDEHELRTLAVKVGVIKSLDDSDVDPDVIYDHVLGVLQERREATEAKPIEQPASGTDELADLLVAVSTAADIGIIAFGKWEATRDVVRRAAVPMAILERQLAGEPLAPSDDEIREANWQCLTKTQQAYLLSLDNAINGIALIRGLDLEIEQGVTPQQWRNNLRSALQRMKRDHTEHGHQLFGKRKDWFRKHTAEILAYSHQLRGCDVPDAADAALTAEDAGDAQRGDPIALDELSIIILEELGKPPLRRHTGYSLEAAINRPRKTIGVRIKSMETVGLVSITKGPTGGVSITKAGRVYLESAR